MHEIAVIEQSVPASCFNLRFIKVKGRLQLFFRPSFHFRFPAGKAPEAERPVLMVVFRIRQINRRPPDGLGLLRKLRVRYRSVSEADGNAAGYGNSVGIRPHIIKSFIAAQRISTPVIMPEVESGRAGRIKPYRTLRTVAGKAVYLQPRRMLFPAFPQMKAQGSFRIVERQAAGSLPPVDAFQPAAFFPGLFPDAEMLRRILAQDKMIPPGQILRQGIQLRRCFHGLSPVLRFQQRGIQMLFPVKQLGRIIPVYGSVCQYSDLPLIGAAAEAGFKPQPPSGQSVPFRIPLEKEGVVKQDFAVRPNAHTDPEGHFFRTVLRMISLEKENRLQGADDLGTASPDHAGQTAGPAQNLFSLSAFMVHPQHRENLVKAAGMPPPAVPGKAFSAFGHRQAEIPARNRPGIPLFLYGDSFRNLRRSGAQSASLSQAFGPGGMAAPFHGSVRPARCHLALHGNGVPRPVLQPKRFLKDPACRPVSAKDSPAPGLPVFHQMDPHETNLSLFFPVCPV